VCLQKASSVNLVNGENNGKADTTSKRKVTGVFLLLIDSLFNNHSSSVHPSAPLHFLHCEFIPFYPLSPPRVSPTRSLMPLVLALCTPPPPLSSPDDDGSIAEGSFFILFFHNGIMASRGLCVRWLIKTQRRVLCGLNSSRY